MLLRPGSLESDPIDINLAAGVSLMNDGLQRPVSPVTAGINSAETPTVDSFCHTELGIHSNPAGDLSWGNDGGRAAYQPWIVANGARDASESTGHFLETARTILGVCSLGERQ